MNRKRLKWPLLLVALSGVAHFFMADKKRELARPSQVEKRHQAFVRALQDIRRWYVEGDWEEHFGNAQNPCSNIMSKKGTADAFFYRCNPHFLECVLKQKKGLIVNDPVLGLKIQAQKRGHELERYKREQFYTKTLPGNTVLITLFVDKPGYYFDIGLKNSCHDVYLPQRIYRYFTDIPKKVDATKAYLWDNFNSHIFIDKFLVRWRDLLDWIETVDLPEVSKMLPTDKEQWHLPAVGLHPEDMRRYCAFRGKQLLTSYHFEAASFLPGDLENPDNKFIKYYFYPWTIRDSESFLKVAEKSEEFSFTAKHCSYVYARECREKFSLNEWTLGLSSWTEVRHLLGGPMEYFYNPLRPRDNLKVSSYHLPFKSPWHKIALKARYEDQQIEWVYPAGARRSRENVRRPKNLEKWDIGFRCLKYVK